MLNSTKTLIPRHGEALTDFIIYCRLSSAKFPCLFILEASTGCLSLRNHTTNLTIQ